MFLVSTLITKRSTQVKYLKILSAGHLLQPKGTYRKRKQKEKSSQRCVRTLHISKTTEVSECEFKYICFFLLKFKLPICIFFYY